MSVLSDMKHSDSYQQRSRTPRLHMAPNIVASLLPLASAAPLVPTSSPPPSSSPPPALSSSDSISPRSPCPPSSCDVFIRNIHPSTSESSLLSHFSPFGSVVSARIIRSSSSSSTGAAVRVSREIGYVRFVLASSALAALRLHGSYLDGRFLLVSLSRRFRDRRDWLFSSLPAEQRERLQMDAVADYSVTDAVTADSLSSLLLHFVPSSSTVTDACACVGGNSISFARHFQSVQACEADRGRFEMLLHNLSVSGLSCRVTAVLASYLDVLPVWRQEAAFIDPPFGADYEQWSIIAPTLGGTGMGEICSRIIRQGRRCRAVLLKLPRNVDWRGLLKELQQAMTRGGGGAGDEQAVRAETEAEAGRAELPNIAKLHYPKLIAVLLETALTPADFRQRIATAPIGGVRDGITRYILRPSALPRLLADNGEHEAITHTSDDAAGAQREEAAVAGRAAADGRDCWEDVSDWSGVEAAVMEELRGRDPHIPFTPAAFATVDAQQAAVATARRDKKPAKARKQPEKQRAAVLQPNPFALISNSEEDEQEARGDE